MLIALTLSTISSAIANAHTALVDSNPAEGAMVSTFPQRVELRFNEPLLTIGGEGTNFFTLTSQAGERLKLGSFSVQGPLLSADVLEDPDASGEFRIEYRVVAGDGHVIKDGFQFSFDLVGGLIGESESPSEQERRAGGDGNDRSVLALSILIVITAAVLIGLLIKSGSRRS